MQFSWLSSHSIEFSVLNAGLESSWGCFSREKGRGIFLLQFFGAHLVCCHVQVLCWCLRKLLNKGPQPQLPCFTTYVAMLPAGYRCVEASYNTATSNYSPGLF